MKIKVFHLIGLSLSFLTCAVSKAANINPKVNRQLQRTVAAYHALGDFGISCNDLNRECGESGKSKSTARFSTDGRMTLRWENGARIYGEHGEKLWPDITAKLFDGKRLTEASDGYPEASLEARFLKGGHPNPDEFFARSTGLRLLSLTLAARKWPALNAGKTPAPVTFRRLPDGLAIIERRGTGTNAWGQPVSVISDLWLDRDGFFKRLESHFHRADGTDEPTDFVEFSRPYPVRAENAFTWKSVALPSKPKFSVSAAARAVIERAARFYGDAKSLALNVAVVNGASRFAKATPSQSRGNRDFLHAKWSWERRGRLRIEGQDFMYQVVSDGVHSWESQDHSLEKAALDTNNADEETLDLFDLHSTFRSVWTPNGDILPRLLRGQSFFPDNWESINSYDARLEKSQFYRGVSCDILKIEEMIPSSGIYPPQPPLDQTQRLWFARSDGRLLRVTQHWGSGANPFGSGEIRFENQKFNVKFPASTWIFTGKGPLKKGLPS